MGRQYCIEIQSLVYGGYGLGRLPEGKTVFVPFVIPGEQAIIRVIEEMRNHAIAELVELKKVNENRLTPRCSHFGFCGGCHHQHILYEFQLSWKEEIITEQLQRLANISSPLVGRTRGSPNEWNYRNAVQFHVSQEGKLCFNDLYKNSPFFVNECHLPLPKINQA